MTREIRILLCAGNAIIRGNRFHYTLVYIISGEGPHYPPVYGLAAALPSLPPPETRAAPASSRLKHQTPEIYNDPEDGAPMGD